MVKLECEPKRKVMGGEKLIAAEPADALACELAEQPEDIPLDIVLRGRNAARDQQAGRAGRASG
jgi:hypothetical protein